MANTRTGVGVARCGGAKDGLPGWSGAVEPIVERSASSIFFAAF